LSSILRRRKSRKKRKSKGEEEMNKSKKTIEINVERTIPAPLVEVFDAWLNPKIPGNPWNAAEKFMLDPKVDGLFYWTLKGTSHYGRFTEVQRPGRIQHTWVSPNTLGEESTVTVTFKKHEENTLMTLVHSDLPDTDGGRSHDNGWKYFLGVFYEQFGNGSAKKYRWEDAHPPMNK
jgi:uncharacterized protein YndB with AHSA1/START domain